MKTVIIQYNAGNIQSVLYALERIGAQAIVSSDIETITSADRVIFPGVGEASSAMTYLKQHQLDKVIMDLSQPVLGICLGMQLMCKHSEENNTECLGIFPNEVKKFPANMGLKVPQMGWNTITELRSSLFHQLPESSFCYFVHSYFAELSEHTIAQTNYGFDYSSALQKDNFYGVQFHPEKSATVGEQILKQFIELI